MAKRKKIRNPKTSEKLYNRLRNAKNKFYRDRKKFGEENIAPIPIPNMTKREIESGLYDRKQMNRMIKELENYTSRGNMETKYYKNSHGTVMPKSVVKNIENYNKKLRRKRDREQKKLDQTEYMTGTEGSGYSVSQIEDLMKDRESSNIYKNIPEIDVDDIRDVEYTEERMKKNEKWFDPEYVYMRKLQYKINFIANVYKRLNSYADELIPLLESIPVEDFDELRKKFSSFRFVDPSVPLTGDEALEEAAALMNVIDLYLSGDADIDDLKFID